MTIGLSFLLGLLASSVSYFMIGLWWPAAVVVGLFAWLAFALLDVKMDSTFTLLGGLLLVFCVSLSAMVFRASDQLSGLQYIDTQSEDGVEFRYPVAVAWKRPLRRGGLQGPRLRCMPHPAGDSRECRAGCQGFDW